MDREEFTSRGVNEDIVFRVVKDGATRVVSVPAKHAHKRSAVFPTFTIGELHGMIVRIGPLRGRAFVAYPCMSYTPEKRK